ncbi:hypothetical protein [Alkalicoccobacillus gibsonii]|uniref:hypothetical protein n=1 Tax=Alkalicoccobacillus gibsonii TaxID=79881 RepID=UPI0019339C77|nr:hypothetical protein [Alkalicoccobacillus gibsonii]MBM0066646.1 hypothetical protein [Alkalicoccobacillus gibsonii]
MKKIITFSTMVLITSTVLVACGEGADKASEVDGNHGTDQEEQVGEEGTVDHSEPVSNEIDDDANSSGLIDKDELNEESNEEGSTNQDDGNTEDQLDLEIGDQATIETTISSFEFTLDSVEIKDELNAVVPDLDVFIVVDFTLTNIYDEPIMIEDATGIFEVTTDLDGGGYGDVSEQYDVDVKTVTGELQPGETISGQLVMEDQTNAEHYIRVNSGLVASSSVKNQAIWTFTEEDSE